MSQMDTPLRPRGTADGDQPALGLHQQVVGLHLMQRASLTVARNVGGDQARICSPQTRRIEAQSRRGPRRQVLQEDVGLRDQSLELGLVGVYAQVERDRLFAPVDPDKVRRLAVHRAVVAAREVAFGTFDLDHPSPGVSESARAKRRGDRLLQRQDQQAVEWFCHLAQCD